MQATDHYRADRTPSSRAGLVRGILVIITAVAIGAFVVSRGIDDPGTGLLAGEGDADLAAGGTTTTAEDLASTPSSDVSGAGATVTTGVTTTSTTEASSTATSTVPADATRPPAEVTVLVLNGSGTKGVAAEGSAVLESAGYELLAPKNADTFGPSQVLFTDGNEAEAEAVAVVFGVDSQEVVAALDPSAPPMDELDDADVIVVIGEDGLIVPT
jgi:hypothetical protein